MTESTFEHDDLLMSGFLSLNPQIAAFPHVLVESGPRTLEVFGKTLGRSLALWGERPLFRADGTSYVEPSDGKIIGDFALWNTRSNQEYLLSRANVGPNPEFKMFIAADTPIAALTRTYEHWSDTTEACKWFGDYIGWVCDWLPALQWALVPLEGEIRWSILAADGKCQQVVSLAEKAFRKNAIRTAHLEPHGGRYRWQSD